jgi:hypothetical protein
VCNECYRSRRESEITTYLINGHAQQNERVRVLSIKYGAGEK